VSDLTRFRDHCRRMATITPPPAKDRAAAVKRDRALWTMLADEVDAYLAGPALPSDADHDPIDYDDPIDEYRHHPTEA
jgi:hypothetical protein